MTLELRLGRALFALGAIALGLESLLLGTPVMRLEGWIKGVPGNEIVGYLTGALLLIGGIGLLFPRWARRAAELFIVIMLCFVALRLMKLIPTATQSDYWGTTFQAIAALGASCALTAILSPDSPAIAAYGRMAGRALFGVSLLIFAGLHYVNASDVEALIPAWMPAHPLLCAATGIASAAAGLAILSGILGRVGAVMVGVMYASWFLLLHIPRVLAAPNDASEWNGALVALLLSGGAFLIAASFTQNTAASEP